MPRYAAIREALAPEYRDLRSEQIEAIVHTQLGSVSPDDVESFLSTLKKVGGAVTKALPAVLPVAGTVAGTALGGPLGAMVGGQLGSLAGGAVGRATGRPGPRRAATAGAAPPAAAQLLGVLNRPEILRGLMSMLMGPAGGRTVPVGGVPVPTGAIANLIGTLANQAAEEERVLAAADGDPLPTYLMDSFGEFRCDPAVPEQRAEVVLELLRHSAPEVVGAAARPLTEYDESDESDESDEMYDALELGDLDSLDAEWEY
jgi:hypothetical protein